MTVTLEQAEDFLRRQYGGAFEYVGKFAKFGENPSVGTAAPEYVWNAPVAFEGFLAAPEYMTLTSDSGDDVNLTGAGAWTVRCEGISEGGDYYIEDLAIGETSSVKLWRCERMSVQNCGTQLGTNVGNLSMTSDVTSKLCAYVAAGEGQTQMAIVTIPADHFAVMVSFDATAETGKSVKAQFWQRPGMDRTSSPFLAKRVVFTESKLLVNGFQRVFLFGPMTDLWVQAQASGGAGASKVDAVFSFYLFKRPGA